MNILMSGEFYIQYMKDKILKSVECYIHNIMGTITLFEFYIHNIKDTIAMYVCHSFTI